MKRIIRLSESDLVRIVKQVLKEQGPLGSASRINLTKPTPSFSGRPPKVELEGGDGGCEYSPEEKVRCFFKDAKTWTGGVDEKYMNDIIEKMKSSLSSLTGDFEFLRLFGLIKSEAGMGYLVKNFKMNNKNLFVVLSEDKSISWIQILFVLKNNFSGQLSSCHGPSGCDGRL
jgi:hypothetical protein